MAISMEEYTQFLIDENKIGNRELMTLQNDSLTIDLLNLFQKQKIDSCIERFIENEEHYIRKCPHFSILIYFTAMSASGKTHEAISNIKRIKTLPYLPANMISTIDKYAMFSEETVTPPDRDTFDPNLILEKIKKDNSQLIPSLAIIQSAIKSGADINEYNNVFRYVLGEPQMPLSYKYQVLEFMNTFDSQTKIHGDFQLAYRNEPARTITIDDDVAAKYDPLLIAFETFTSKIENMNEIVRSSMRNFLAMYHYLNYGKTFPFRSSEQMEIFIFYALSQISRSIGKDPSYLHTELIPGYDTAYDIRQEVDKFLLYISTDLM